MHFLAGYAARHVPRYGPEEMGRRVADHLLAQRAFWNAAHLHRMGSGRGQEGVECVQSIEVRVLAGVPERRSTLQLLLWGQPGNAGLDRRSLESLMPAGYAWVRQASDKAAQSGLGSVPADGWYVARLVRRMEFAALPPLSVLATQVLARKVDADVGAESARPNLSAMDAVVSALGEWAGRDPDQPRRLPGSLTTLADLRWAHDFCLPILGALSDDLPHSRRLWQELQEVAPAVLSITLHRAPGEPQATDRLIASSWQRLLAPFVAALANAGFAEYGRLRAAYDRYMLPSPYLAHVSIRIAAREPELALGVADQVCSRLGGARAFRVYPPTRQLHLEQLPEASVDIPTDAWNDERWARWRDRLGKLLEESHVNLPDKEPYWKFLLRMPHLYTVEETEKLLQLPYADDEGLPGFDTEMVPPFSAPSLPYAPVVNPSEGGLTPPPEKFIRVGMVQTSPVVSDPGERPEKRLGSANWHQISVDDMCKHTLVVGSTGSGKSMVTGFLLRGLDRLPRARPLPFTVIEPVKTEYHDRLKGKIAGLRRKSFEDDRDLETFLAFDPMRLQKGVTVARHASFLKACFEAAFPLEPWRALILESGIRSYYKDHCNLDLFQEGGAEMHKLREDAKTVYPSMADFRDYFLNTFLDKVLPLGGADPEQDSYTQANRKLFERRFVNLMDGVLGCSFKLADDLFLCDRGNYEPLDELWDGRFVIELDAVPDAEQKALIMALLLTFLFERRQADDLAVRKAGQRPKLELRHALVIEEAHRLLSNAAAVGRRSHEVAGQDPREKAVQMFIDMLAELRAYGQALIIVEQIPTKIVPDAVKNTNLKVMLRLSAEDDRDYLGEAMNLTAAEKRFVTGLRARQGEGIQFVAFEEGVNEPVHLHLPLASREELDKGWLFDEFFPAAP